MINLDDYGFSFDARDFARHVKTIDGTVHDGHSRTKQFLKRVWLETDIPQFLCNNKHMHTHSHNYASVERKEFATSLALTATPHMSFTERSRDENPKMYLHHEPIWGRKKKRPMKCFGVKQPK
jgi:hypothetical protein